MSLVRSAVSLLDFTARRDRAIAEARTVEGPGRDKGLMVPERRKIIDATLIDQLRADAGVMTTSEVVLSPKMIST